MLQPGLEHATVDPVEVVLRDEEGVVLGLDLDAGLGEHDATFVVELHDAERSPSPGFGGERTAR